MSGWERYEYADQYPLGTMVDALHFGNDDDESQIVTPAVFVPFGLKILSNSHGKSSTVTHIRKTATGGRK